MQSEKHLIDENEIYTLFRENGTAKLHVADIDVLPRVTAAPVVHGKWVTWQELFPKKFSLLSLAKNKGFCSHCGAFRKKDNYCPNCGAKMDGGNEDGLHCT